MKLHQINDVETLMQRLYSPE